MRPSTIVLCSMQHFKLVHIAHNIRSVTLSYNYLNGHVPLPSDTEFLAANMLDSPGSCNSLARYLAFYEALL